MDLSTKDTVIFLINGQLDCVQVGEGRKPIVVYDHATGKDALFEEGHTCNAQAFTIEGAAAATWPRGE